jgi:hypothetical protein
VTPDDHAERAVDANRVGVVGLIALQYLTLVEIDPAGGLLQGVGDEVLLESRVRHPG